jgi:hypothetical protein
MGRNIKNIGYKEFIDGFATVMSIWSLKAFRKYKKKYALWMLWETTNFVKLSKKFYIMIIITYWI